MKCGRPELKKGIKSIDLAQSYKSLGGNLDKPNQEKHQSLQQELEEWATREFRILRVLVTAGLRGEADDVEVIPYVETKDKAEPEDNKPKSDERAKIGEMHKDDGNSKDDEKPNHSERIKVKRGTSCLEYFIRCDAEQTELFFGSEFKTLLAAIRGGDRSLLPLYKNLNRPSKAHDQPMTRVPKEKT